MNDTSHTRRNAEVIEPGLEPGLELADRDQSPATATAFSDLSPPGPARMIHSGRVLVAVRITVLSGGGEIRTLERR